MATKQNLQTRLIHIPNEAFPSKSVSPPIFQTSTFRLDGAEEGREFGVAVAPNQFYSRLGNPNNTQVEAVLKELEGGEAAMVVASGMAAVSIALISNIHKGEHIVAQKTHYTSSLSLMELLQEYGVEITLVDQTDTSAFERAIQPNTKVVYTESPSNPIMALTDLRATAALAHANGAIAITDNTFASSFNQQPLSLGYDMVIHSATKYLNGHADVTAGVLVGKQELIDKAWTYLRVLGGCSHPFESWLLRRGLQTYGLRLPVHNSNALKVAQFLEAHSAVRKVYYPGLPSHPQHELAKQQMTGGFGGMLSFELHGGFDAGVKLISSTKVCVLAVSLGGMETLICHPASMVHTHQNEDQRDEAGISSGLIRLSVGLENVQDIIDDLAQAIDTAASQ